MILLIIFNVLSILFALFHAYYFEYLNGGLKFYTTPLIYLATFISLIIIMVLVLWLILQFKSKNKLRSNRFFSFFTTQVAQAASILFRVKVIKENFELIPKKKPFMLISNHQSIHDPITMVGALRKYDVSYIMKDGVTKLPFVGPWLLASGFLPIDRFNDRNALRTIINATKVIESGRPVAAYPEGTRSKDTLIGEFKSGIFKIAQKTKVPIIVVLIDNFYNVRNNFPWRRTHVMFRVCEVIEPASFAGMQTVDIAKMARDILVNNLAEVRENYKLQKKKLQK